MNEIVRNTPAPRLESIQALRFVAASLVMCAHAKMVLREDEVSASWDAAMFACGVDVFFVISGYVVAMSATRAAGACRFMADRALRVLPLYFLVSALFVAKRVASGEAMTSDELINSVLFLPFLDMGAYTSPMHPYGWSIAYEMWFYGLLAVFLGLVGKARAPSVCAAALAGGCGVVALAYDGAWLLPRFLFSPLVLEFSAGCALFLWREKLRRFAWAAWAGLPLFGAGVACTSYLGYPTEVVGNAGLGFARALIWGGLAVCVFTLFYAAEEKVKWPRSLVALGTASYSIYLIQPFVVKAVSGLPVAGSVRVACFIAVSVVLGGLMYLWLERPLLTWSKAWLRRPAAPVLPVKDAEELQRAPA